MEVILDTPPVTRLVLRNKAKTLIVFSLAFANIATVYLFLEPALPTNTVAFAVQLVIGCMIAVAGTIWLSCSWIPGQGRSTDIIIPWTLIFVLAGIAYLVEGEIALSSLSAHWPVLLGIAVPVQIGYTLLTRLYAPTDLCSASSAIGFSAGGVAAVISAFFFPPLSFAAALISLALIVGCTMGASRIVLCHFIRW